MLISVLGLLKCWLIEIARLWRSLFLLIYVVPIVAPILGDVGLTWISFGLTWISSLSGYPPPIGLLGLGEKCAVLLLWLGLWWVGFRVIRGLSQTYARERVDGHQRAANWALAIVMGLPFLFMLFIPWWRSEWDYLMVFALFAQGLGLILAIVVGVIGAFQYLRQAPFSGGDP